MSYGSLLRLPGALRLVLGATIGRLSFPMATVAIVLLIVDARGSFAAAGAVAAAHALAAGVMATALGRLVDRRGHWPTLPILASINAGAAVGLVVATRAGAPVPAMIALAAAMGASTPPLPGCMRALWPVLTGGGERLQTAFALEAALLEVIIITGSLLTAALVALASPDLALLTGASLVVGGTTAFATSAYSREQVGAWSSSGWAGALASAGMRTLMLAILPVGFTFGLLQLTVAAFAVERGSRAATGVLLTGWGVGALISSLWYGRRRWIVDAWRRYVVLLCLFPLGLLALAFPGSLLAMLPMMVVAGMPAGPMHATSFSLVNRLAPPNTVTEAFTVTRTALALGVALGASLAGGLVETVGASSAFAIGAAAAATAPLIVLLRRRTLGVEPSAGRERARPLGRVHALSTRGPVVRARDGT